jgi:hypothetical protein
LQAQQWARSSHERKKGGLGMVVRVPVPVPYRLYM